MRRKRKTYYAAVPINTKACDDGLHVRRVLISYTEEYKRGKWPVLLVYFGGSKLLAWDPYFDDESASHRYSLANDGYTLAPLDEGHPNADGYDEAGLYQFREYHIYEADYMNPLPPRNVAMCRIEASSDEEAIALFHGRDELR